MCFVVKRWHQHQGKQPEKSISKETLDLARKLLSEGKSKRHVADLLEMPESSLRKRLKRENVATSLGRYKPTFTVETERELVSYIKTLDSMFYGLTMKKLRSLVYEYAEENNIKHQFNRDTKAAGKNWVRGFLRRNPEISLRQPTSTSIARAMGFNKPQVDRFYDQLFEILQKFNFQPCDIYNMDESGFSTVPNKAPKVLSIKGKRCVNKISSAERGTNVTVVCAMSASGTYIPPAFIFPRKRMKAELLDGAPPSSIGLVTDSGRMNTELFVDWLQHYKYHAKPTATRPLLLILDNYLSHTSLEAVNFCRKNYIHVLTIPPHSTHKMQPLDRCFFAPLKKYFAHECEKWMLNHPARPITIYQIATLFTAAYNKTATVSNAVEGFKVGGICQYNRDLFTEVDFLASSVTDRPLLETESNLPEIHSINPFDENPQSQENLVVISATIEEAHSSEHCVDIPTPLDQNVDNPQLSTSFEVISPLPKSNILRPTSNRSKRSEIITSSPYKRQLESEHEQKSNKKIPKKTPKKPANPPKTKKKNWQCPGCKENYKEPITEDWIECSRCTEWWHDKCTSYIGIGTYCCDLCQ